jgi:hypothetical protein
VAAETITAFAEIAKKSQIVSIEIMMVAGKSRQRRGDVGSHRTDQ